MTTKFLIFQIFTLFSIILPNANSNVFNYPAVFNFGDSNSDTGETYAGLGTLPNPANGKTYFNASSGRSCDGRLIIDFFMQSMNFEFLHPYLDSVGMRSFRQGCNYAAAGSTILPPAPGDSSPFSFDIQVNQFIHFKAQALELLVKGKDLEQYLPAEDSFAKGLYMFDIGQNDIDVAVSTNTTDQVHALIPKILAEFEKGLKRLYDQGARNFWIHNTGPLGCIPRIVLQDQSNLDELGCVSQYNDAAKLFNQQLNALCKKLLGDLKDSNIIYVDIYTIKSDLIANYSLYGFEQPITACCEIRDTPYNISLPAPCGLTEVIEDVTYTAEECNETNKYVNWDGTHYTEAANLHVSKQILTGLYSDPPFADKMLSIPDLKF